MDMSTVSGINRKYFMQADLWKKGISNGAEALTSQK